MSKKKSQPDKKAPRQMRNKGKAKRGKHHARTPTRRARELTEIVEMPGMNLSRVYVGVVKQSQCVNEAAHPGIPRKDVVILSEIMSRNLQKLDETGNVEKTLSAGHRMQRGMNAAEDIRVRWYGAESAVGAAAMQIDGVRRVEELHRTLKAEKKQGRTIDTMPEEPLG